MLSNCLSSSQMQIPYTQTQCLLSHIEGQNDAASWKGELAGPKRSAVGGISGSVKKRRGILAHAWEVF